MVDLHTHILPGMDDGAKTLEQSILMVEQAEKIGVTTICATPHILGQVTFQLEEKIKRNFDLLKTKMTQMGSKLEMVLGAEIYVREDLDSLMKFDFSTINNTGRYLLMELPRGQFPPHLDRIVFELLLEGKVPIIAHPERSIITMKQSVYVENLVQKGALMQIDAGSLLGFWGRKIKSITEELLKRNLVHFLASDAHDHLFFPIQILSPAFARASKIMGREKAEKLVASNPYRVIKGEGLINVKMPSCFENEPEEETCNLN